MSRIAQHLLSRRALVGGAAAATLQAQRSQETVRLPRKVRIALAGLEGHTGEILGPLPQLPDVELVAISDPDPKALERAARNPRMSAVKKYTDYRRMLESEQLDMIGVCGPNGGRSTVVQACVDRKLHVIAEKPLATEMPDLARLKKAVARTGIRLSMLLPMRFSPSYLALKQIVDSGEIGEVAQIGAQKSYKLGQRPDWYRRRSTYGGTIPWIGIHMVDLMRWTSGREFTEAASFQSRIAFPELGEMENVTASLFRLDNGGAATLRMDYFRPETAPTHGDDRLRLAGLKGIAEYQPGTGVTVMSGNRKPEVIRDLPQGRHVFVDFLESVYSGKTAALSAEDIFRVNEIVLIARDAGDRGQILKCRA
jgi:predicted dehydrogenase